MKAFLALMCVVLNWVGSAAAQEVTAHDFDRQKLERTRALVEARDEDVAPEPSTTPHDLQSSVGTMGKGLILTLAAFFIGLHVYRRYAGVPKSSATRAMRIIEKLTISNRCAVLLVEVNGQQQLIATGPEPVTFGPALSSRLSTFAGDLEQVEAKQSGPTPLAAQIERDIVWHGA